MRFVIFMLVLSLHLFASENYKLVRIPVKNMEQIREIQKTGIDLEGSKFVKNEYIEFVASERDIRVLHNNFFETKIVIDDLKSFYKSRLVTREGEGFGYGSMGGNYTFSEVCDQLDSMTAQYPNLITPKYTIGTSWENRDIWAIKISDNPSLQESEPEVLFTGLHHAREPVSMMNLLYFMWHLLENYGSDPEVTYLVDNRQIYFVPVVNPDGYVYNEQTDPNGGGMWRKNKRDNDGNGIFSSYSDGVDLNRNYGYNWGFDNIGSSPTQSSDTYRGPAPFSEPETQVIRDFSNIHEFKTALNYHTYSDLLIHPWAYSESHTPDSTLFVMYAQIMTQFNGYTFGTPGQTVGYQVNGDTNDWMYGEQVTKSKILAMTPEVGGGSDGFWPPTYRILPLCQENLFPNMFYTHVAGGYVRVTDFVFQNVYNGYPDPGENPELIFTVGNIGLDDSENFDITFYSINPQVSLSNETVTFPALPAQQSSDNSADPVIVHLDPSLNPGQNIALAYDVTIGGQAIRSDTIRFTVGTPAVFFADDAEQGNANFSFSNGWGFHMSSYVSPSHSFTESPSGNYPSYANRYMTSNNINLSNATNAQLTYQTKWDIEAGWDFARIELKVQGSSVWHNLVAPGMTQGSGQGAQSSSDYGYDGTQNDWILESIDISQYTGSNIQLRFILESDSYIERDGWYIDDIAILTYPPADTIAPVISQVQHPPYTVPPDPDGYDIQAQVSDNKNLTIVDLFYNSGSGFDQLMMNALNDSVFAGTIPYQQPGTLVNYYIQAVDGQGNIATSPVNAPDSTYQFQVKVDGAYLYLSQSQFEFSGTNATAASRHLLIHNPGNESLHVSLEENLLSSELFPTFSRSLSSSISDLKYIINRNLDPNDLTLHAPTNPENIEKILVITDSLNDTNQPYADISEIQVLRASTFGMETTSFYITFAAPPDSGLVGFISVDLDQEFGTGAFPVPFGHNLPFFDIGSEIELVFDFGANLIDTLGLGPLALAFDSGDSSIIGVTAVNFSGNMASAEFIYTSLTGGAQFDDHFNLAAGFLSMTDMIIPDNAPDFGHGTYGNDLPISWLSALPRNFSLGPGDSLLMPVQVVYSQPPGIYNASLDFHSNDSSALVKTVDINVEVLELMHPDLYLPQVVMYDTVETGTDADGYFMIENRGEGMLQFGMEDSTSGEDNWFQLMEPAGYVFPDSSMRIPYMIRIDSLVTGSDFFVRINILSNDPDTPFSHVDMYIHKTDPSAIGRDKKVPQAYELEQNYPNPFNPVTVISYGLPVTSNVTLTIYNTLGQKMNTLVSGKQNAGKYEIKWNAAGFPSGVYYFKLQAGTFVSYRKMVLLR